MLTLSGLGQTDEDGQADLEAMAAGYYQATAAAQAESERAPSWWEAPLTDITKGITQGLFERDKAPTRAPGARMPAKEEAWYTTPTGMVGIGAGILALVLLLRK
jgi:hypothetical protein